MKAVVPEGLRDGLFDLPDWEFGEGVVEYARRAADLPDYAPIVQLPPPQTTLVGQLLGVEGMQAAQPAQVLPAQLLDLAKALAPFVVHDPDQPLALTEFSQTGF